jgi:signal transduction histidine kinase
MQSGRGIESGMSESNLSLIRIILIPYLILLALFVVVTGAGSTWLYFKARQAQSRLVVHGLLTSVTPLVERLSKVDIDPLLAEDSHSWLHTEINTIFRQIPDLEHVRVRSRGEGIHKYHDAGNRLVTEKTGGYKKEGAGDLRDVTAASRLYSESAPLLRIEFLLEGRGKDPVRLEFGFNRATLRETVGRAMDGIIRAITLFSLLGIGALCIAFGVTVWAAGRVRELEKRVRELYRYATAAELMAGLVHDLRNPLASFRANLASLRIMPEEQDDIIEEMDRDLVRLDEKLGSMLDLTRKRDEPLAEVDMKELLAEVARLAEPVLARNGLELQCRSRVKGMVAIMMDSIRDALLNLVINSAESGQKDGIIELEVWREDGRLIFEIRDRGCGLPEDLDIFAPFVTTKSTGHGLGLAITRRTIEAHGGTVSAKNRTNGGAVLRLMLPGGDISRGAAI